MTRPADDSESLQGDLDFLLGAYFSLQADYEARLGRAAVPAWARERGAATAAKVAPVITDPLGRAKRVLDGLDTMLGIYPGSSKTLTEVPGGYQLTVSRCGIYAYREAARARGEVITLEKPCEFCVPMHQGEGDRLGIEVVNQPGDRGCTYVARVREAGDGR